MLLATDTSKWEDKEYDFPRLFAGGIVANTTKATQGTYYKDPRYLYFLEGAKLAGMDSGAFQFFDPDPDQNPIGQIHFLMDFIHGFQTKPDYLCLDIEREFYRRTKILKQKKKEKGTAIVEEIRVSAGDLYARIRQAAEVLEQQGYPVCYYTRISWIDEFCPQLWDWLHTKPLILAQYIDTHSYHNLTTEKESAWLMKVMGMADTWMEKSVRGVEATNLLMWQFTEHYMGTGMGNDTDLNLILSEKRWHDFLSKSSIITEPVSVETPELIEKVNLLWTAHPELHRLNQ
jgi:GH25 family lysozyme M1 (1,4-beta-N-acetylmuramidase)